MFICKECNKEFEMMSSLRKHRSFSHKISSEQTYIEYNLGGIQPLCKCGCGNKTNFLSFEKGFVDYVLGHASRINNNWGHNKEAVRKSHETQKKMYESGELVIWNKGLTIEDERVKDYITKVMGNPERGKNISKKLTGVKKSEESKEKNRKSQILSWANEEKRLKQSLKRVDWISKNNFKFTSKLETTFNTILNELGLTEHVDYSRWYYVRDIKAFYDFYLIKLNIMIEIDGDFWHCNPNSKFSEPLYASQRKNVIKDKIKNEWCANNNIELIRFWENDIKNNLEDVILKLKTLL